MAYLFMIHGILPKGVNHTITITPLDAVDHSEIAVGIQLILSIARIKPHQSQIVHKSLTHERISKTDLAYEPHNDAVEDVLHNWEDTDVIITKTVNDFSQQDFNFHGAIGEPPRTKTTETEHYYQVANKNTHEERRFQIEEIDEWRAHNPRTHDKLRLRQNKPDTSLNQLKVGDKVLLDAADPHIITTTPNEEIPLTVLSIFPFGTVEVIHPKFGTFKVVMTNNDDPGTIHFRLSGLVCAMSVPEFGVTLGLYTYEFMEEEDMNAQPRNIHISPSLCWKALAPLSSTYDLSCSKASALPPFPTCMANAHVTDLAYFISFAIRYQTKRHKKGVISIDPYLMRLARHFGLLNTVAQSSTLTLIGQMSPQGITTMLHIRMIERQRRIDPPQYSLSHAIDEEDLEDIPDNVLPQEFHLLSSYDFLYFE
ncbi:hypothetical protein GOBAR_AA22462 [Gossypium barbadense]|uniref:Uncharacterized protein n=1 Tax=Gossypium barbadense TaxID=3634 RepID=A0A2P5X4G5_GOSBA|nr:hypothetical protein GOBAR_AA22462 [Gossypium barbadense]